MRPAEFEEKEYEGFLYSQLQVGPHCLWSPGQVLEAYLGFDHALFLDDPFLWNLYGIPRPYPGVLLARLHILRRAAGSGLRDRLPQFRMNCFLQAKRPDFGTRAPKKLVGLGSARPYFKIALNLDQQQTIVALANQIKGRGLFVYAAPAFWQSRQLFANGTAGTVVQQSTFPEAIMLRGHKAFYYNAPGTVGIVNEGFDRVEFPSLEDSITRMRAEPIPDNQSEATESEALGDLRREVQRAVTTTSEAGDQPRNAYLVEEWRGIDRLAEGTGMPAALVSFLYVEAFTRFFSLRWLVIA